MPQLHQFDQFNPYDPYDPYDRPDAAETASTDETAGTVATSRGRAARRTRPCAELSDAELTALVRTDEPIARMAVAELRRRHGPAVLSYARICCRDAHAAEELADEAFQYAQQAAQASLGPKVSWRHSLLILVQHAAARWATTTRRAELGPDFAAWLDEAAGNTQGTSPDLRLLESRSLMLLGFRALPERTQAVLWHAVVEEDDDSDTALLLGIGPRSVPHLREKAREAHREAYLQVRATHCSDDCRRFSGLVEAAARRSGIHQNADLDRHLADCPRCSRILTDLIGMSERPDAVLAEGLLMWGGAAYVAARLTKTVAGRTINVPTPQGARTSSGRPPASGRSAAPGSRKGSGTSSIPNAQGGPDTSGGSSGMGIFGGPSSTGTTRRAGHAAADTAHSADRAPGHRSLGSPVQRLSGLTHRFPALGAAAAVVAISAAAATTIVTLVPSNSSTAVGSGAPIGVPPLVISRTTTVATVTATVALPPALSPTPSASDRSAASASSSHAADRPSVPPQNSAGSTARSTPSNPGAPIPPPPTRGVSFNELVNADSGLCLDVRDQFLEQGADAIVHSCTGATSQKWYLDADHLLHNYADPRFCLDSRGDPDRGVGVWDCSSADGDHGGNLRFREGPDGTIRPFINAQDALTPTGNRSDDSVAFQPAEGRTDQSWHAGATAVLAD